MPRADGVIHFSFMHPRTFYVVSKELQVKMEAKEEGIQDGPKDDEKGSL